MSGLQEIAAKQRTETRSFYRSLLVSLFLAGLGALVFSQVAGHSFVNYDDFEHVSQNPYVERGLTVESIRWAFLPGDDWMPLAKLSHMAVFQFFGPEPAAHHLANLFLHAINAILLFHVLKIWTGDFWRSAAVAVLFSVHPVQAEAVSWVMARKNLLSAFFGFLTLRAYLKLPPKPRAPDLFFVSFFFLLSLMSNPILAALPVFLVLIDGKLLKNKAPLFLISAAFCFIVPVVQHKALQFSSSTPVVFRAAGAIVFYLSKIFFPAALAIYGHVPDKAVPVWQGALCAALLFSATLFLWKKRRNFFYAFAGWCWFLSFLAPAVVLEVPADRYLYFSVIGILIGAVWALPKTKIWSVAGIAAAVGVLAPLSYAQAAVWKNSAALFSHALKIDDQNYTAHVNFAETLVDQGLLDEAAGHYRRALDLDSKNAEALTSLGVVFENQGKLAESERFHREALRVSPHDAKAHFNLANVLQKQGRRAEAIGHFKEAARLKPDFAQAYFNAAYALEEEGRPDEAESYYSKALRIKPDYRNARINLGLLVSQQRRYAEAIAHFSQALKSNQNDLEARNDLAITLARSGNTQEAIGHLRRIVQEHPESEAARQNLALLDSKIEKK